MTDAPPMTANQIKRELRKRMKRNRAKARAHVEPHHWTRRICKEMIQHPRAQAFIQLNAGTEKVGVEVERMYLAVCAAASRLKRTREEKRATLPF